MTAPESRPDIESTLTDALRRRHAGQPAAHPSLVDVRRRAHRRSTRSAATRTGAVVAAGAAVVAGGWAVTRDDSDSSAAGPAMPTDALTPPDPVSGQMVTTLSVDGLWEAVAAQLGVTAADLRHANPEVDFTKAPVPGTLIVLPGNRLPTDLTTTTPSPSPTFVNILTTTSFVLPPETTTTLSGGEGPSSLDVATTTTVVRAADGSSCVLDDAQVQVMADYARSLPGPGSTMPPPVSAPTLPAGCLGLPRLPTGWTFYVIAPGDYLYGVAQRFCTTADELVAGNGWASIDVPIFSGQVIAVPADGC